MYNITNEEAFVEPGDHILQRWYAVLGYPDDNGLLRRPIGLWVPSHRGWLLQRLAGGDITGRYHHDIHSEAVGTDNMVNPSQEPFTSGQEP